MDYIFNDAKKAAAAVLVGGLFAIPPVVANASTQYLSAQGSKNTLSTRSSRKKGNFSEYVVPSVGREAKLEVSIDATLLKSIPTVALVESGNSGFYGRVESVMKSFGLNKSQLSAVLNVQRKSIYDWQAKPEIEVREGTLKRVHALEELQNYMDEGHSPMTGKLSFGSLGHKDLASELISKSLDIVKLKKLYDRYWLEFDGLSKRAALTRATKGFERKPLDEVNFAGA